MTENAHIPERNKAQSLERGDVQEGIEHRKGLRITQIETDNRIVRGAVTIDPTDPDIRKIKIGYPPELAGREIDLKKTPLKVGEPFEYRENNSDWKMASPLRGIAIWETSTFTAFEEIERLSSFPSSKGIPGNPYTGREVSPETYADYGAQLESYDTYWPEQEPGDETRKAVFAFETGMGWKAHINATPENVVAISKYLKENGYHHKYLSGGHPIDGKVFTVYFGSKQKLDQWTPLIATDLEKHLSAPGALDEMEAARGIAARFDPGVKRGDDFFRYGHCGVPFTRGDTPEQSVQHRRALLQGTAEEKIEAARVSYEKLKQQYGSYFTG